MSKLPSCVRLGLPRLSSPWIGVAAVVFGACSGALTEYTSTVAPSPSFERPLIEARRCLETFGFDMKIIDVRAGLVSGERFELADDESPTLIVSEVSVLGGDDSVRIIARSRRASPASEGWESVRVSEGVRRTVDRVVDRLKSGRTRSRTRCGSVLPHERDDVARNGNSRPDRRAGAAPASPRRHPP